MTQARQEIIQAKPKPMYDWSCPYIAATLDKKLPLPGDF
jgi:hypothetical protein